MSKVRICASLDPVLIDRLDHLAAQEARSRSAMLNLTLEHLFGGAPVRRKPGPRHGFTHHAARAGASPEIANPKEIAA